MVPQAYRGPTTRFIRVDCRSLQQSRYRPVPSLMKNNRLVPRERKSRNLGLRPGVVAGFCVLVEEGLSFDVRQMTSEDDQCLEGLRLNGEVRT